MIKRLLAVVVALLFVASGCSSNDESATELKKIKFMLDWTPNTNHSGVYLAKDRGYYRDAGLDVEVLQPGQQGALASLGSGEVDFAVAVQEQLIPARAQGVPVVSLAAILSTNTTSLVSLQNDNINRPRDLENKTYGGYGGNLERQLVETLVSCDGGDPNKVKWAEVGDVDYRAGLEQNKFDFAWLFDGWDVLRLQQQNVPINKITFADYQSCIPDWYTLLIATNENKINSDPETVRAFMDATARGYKDAIADAPAAADSLLKAAPELDADLVRGSQSYVATKLAKPGQMWGTQDTGSWSKFEEFLRNSKLTETHVDVNKAFTNDFLPKT